MSLTLSLNINEYSVPEIILISNYVNYSLIMACLWNVYGKVKSTTLTLLIDILYYQLIFVIT